MIEHLIGRAPFAALHLPPKSVASEAKRKGYLTSLLAVLGKSSLPTVIGGDFNSESAPAWLRAAMAVNPLTYGVAALRHALDAAASGLPSSGLSVAVTFAFALGAVLVAAAVINRYPAGPDRAAFRSRRKKP